MRVLFHRQVPQIPSVTTMVSQYDFLVRRGKQAILGHANTLSIITDISGR